MKKILSFVCLFFSVFSLIGCNKEDVHNHTVAYTQLETSHYKRYTCGCSFLEEALPHKDLDENGYCDGCDYNLNTNTTYLFTTFKTAYAKSFMEDFEVDLNNVTIVDYYGAMDDAHLVSIDSNYLDKGYPNGAYIESVEGMEFRYDLSSRVYIVYNQALYTAKAAYEKEIIDFNGLCKVFGLHTSKKSTFHEGVYEKLASYMEERYEENANLYRLAKYCGEYNGYYAVSYNYLGAQAAVAFEESVNHLNFGYGYESSRIRFINGSTSYTLSGAYAKGIINDQELYDLLELRTKSKEVDGELVEQLLTPAYELCLKYKDDFNKEVKFDYFYLQKYYGKYGDSYIYDLKSSYWINRNSTAASPEEIEVMEYGFGDIAYVLNNGKLYTLDQALKAGIITQEIKTEIINKYYEI